MTRRAIVAIVSTCLLAGCSAVGPAATGVAPPQAQPPSSVDEALAALEGLAGRNSALHISIESATNTVQMQQQSSRLDVIGAVQTLSNADMTGGDTGQQMDVSG